MTATVVIQARVGSTRLPGKVLEPVAGRPLLGLMLDRLAPLSSAGLTLVVATSDLAADDPVVDVAADRGVATVRGPEADVLRRVRLAVAEHPAGDIVRLTADCPLHDPAVVLAVLAHHRRAGAAYTSNTLTRTFPDGLDTEVVTATALCVADEEAVDPSEREHVTPFVYRRPSRFLLAQHTTDALAGDERWTIDVAADLAWLRRTVDRLEDPVGAPWSAVLDAVGRAPAPGMRLVPVPLADPGDLGPWRRRWLVLDARGDQVGEATVVVDDGVGALAVDTDAGVDVESVAALVRRALGADAQVAELRRA